MALVSSGAAGAAPAKGKGKKPADAVEQESAEQRHDKQVRERWEDPEDEAAHQGEQTIDREARKEGESASSERSKEMQARKQERKEIKEEYKTAQGSDEASQVKGKKPWWKFWESEDSD